MTEARKITSALGGRWHGSYGTAPCPVCQAEHREDQTALTLSDGQRRLLLNCKKSGCNFIDVLRAAGVTGQRHQGQPLLPSVNQAPGGAATSGYAKKLWQSSVEIKGSPAEAYLRSTRKIVCPLPATLRYNPQTAHGPSKQNLPAMIALIEGGATVAVSRTYLRPDGTGKAEVPKAQQKMMLGGARGGHVTVQNCSGTIIIAEGIETALSLPQVLDTSRATIWAALSATNLRVVNLPSPAGHLLIASDGDEAGQQASYDLASRAARLGWSVELKPAPEGRDWNDVLCEQIADLDGCDCANVTQAGGKHGL
jgi:hypothetical protein